MGEQHGLEEQRVGERPAEGHPVAEDPTAEPRIAAHRAAERDREDEEKDAYVFGGREPDDRARRLESTRLGALEDVFGPPTRTRLSELGVREGWRCWEVGCGAGGIARWLAGRVGETGHVLATDLDPSYVEGHGLPNLSVLRHDLLADPPERDHFDLVHARALLEHVAERGEALQRMVSATRPGGWVVVEDFDIEGAMTPAAARYYPPEHRALGERLGRALAARFAASGVDAGLGRRLPEMLLAAGLTEVGAALYAPVGTAGGPPFLRLTLGRLRPGLVAAGGMTEEEVDRVMDLIERPGFTHVPGFMVTAWGRRARA
ncbi:methyltransferase [Streptomyces sp. URMC 123]|uniref:methyltransferase n=1 Tax=Streptomyces sp. URMC 123 TaxID=3423403 RepID=UPI003F1A9E59